MAIGLRKRENETWREAVERYAEVGGLEEECVTFFDKFVKEGVPEPEAAFDALYEWDCLEFMPDGDGNEKATTSGSNPPVVASESNS